MALDTLAPEEATDKQAAEAVEHEEAAEDSQPQKLTAAEEAVEAAAEEGVPTAEADKDEEATENSQPEKLETAAEEAAQESRSCADAGPANPTVEPEKLIAAERAAEEGVQEGVQEEGAQAGPNSESHPMTSWHHQCPPPLHLCTGGQDLHLHLLPGCRKESDLLPRLVN